MQVRGTGEAGMSEQRPGFEEPSSRAPGPVVRPEGAYLC